MEVEVTRDNHDDAGKGIAFLVVVAFVALFLFGCAHGGDVTAQAPEVHGAVTDTSNAVLTLFAVQKFHHRGGTGPVAHASIRLNGQESVTGSVTAEDGIAIVHLQPGRYVVIWQAVGLKRHSETIFLRSGEVRTLKHNFGRPLPVKEQV